MTDLPMQSSKIRRSAECNEFAAALAKAQGEYKAIEKKREAVVVGRAKESGREYNYRYKYADLGDVLKVALPILSKHGIAFTQPTMIDGGIIYIVTTLMHSSGQWQESDFPVIQFAGKKHQQLGEALTFAKRYAGCAALGIAPEETIEGDDMGADVDVGAPQRPSAPPIREAPAVVQSGQRELPPVVNGPAPEGPQEPAGSPQGGLLLTWPDGKRADFKATKSGAMDFLSKLEVAAAVNRDTWEINKATVAWLIDTATDEEVKKRATAIENAMEQTELAGV